MKPESTRGEFCAIHYRERTHEKRLLIAVLDSQVLALLIQPQQDAYKANTSNHPNYPIICSLPLCAVDHALFVLTSQYLSLTDLRPRTPQIFYKPITQFIIYFEDIKPKPRKEVF
jgi:hypothetical protein